MKKLIFFGLAVLLCAAVCGEKTYAQKSSRSSQKKSMSVLGKWKVSKSMWYDADMNRIYIGQDELKAEMIKRGDDENEIADSMQMFGIVFDFRTDNTLAMLMPIPEGMSKAEIDKAVAEGQIKIVDGMAEMQGESTHWKEENGEFFVDLAGWSKIDIVDNNNIIVFPFYLTRM